MKNPSLKQFKLLKEEPHHFEVMHPDGSSFKIAKEPLDDDSHEFIRGLEFHKGGQVQSYADGGDVAKEFEPGVDYSQERLPGQPRMPSPDTDNSETVDEAPTTRQPQQQTPEQDALSAARTAVPPPQVEQPPQKASVTPPPADDLFTRSEKQAEKQVSVMGDTQKRILDQWTNYMGRRDALEKQLQDPNSQINPNRLWQNKSTPAKIMSGLAVVLSGIGAGLTGKNTALDMINSQVADDIDAQKANLGTKKTLLEQYYKETGSLQTASLQASNDLLTAIKTQIDTAIQQAQSPMRQMQLQVESEKLKGLIQDNFSKGLINSFKGAAMPPGLGGTQAATTQGGQPAVQSTDKKALLGALPESEKNQWAIIPSQKPGAPDELAQTGGKDESQFLTTKIPQIRDAIASLDALKSKLDARPEPTDLEKMVGLQNRIESFGLPEFEVGGVPIHLGYREDHAKAMDNLASIAANKIDQALKYNKQGQARESSMGEIRKELHYGMGLRPEVLEDAINNYKEALQREEASVRKSTVLRTIK